jgi:hypothetical protein
MNHFDFNEFSETMWPCVLKFKIKQHLITLPHALALLKNIDDLSGAHEKEFLEYVNVLLSIPELTKNIDFLLMDFFSQD